MFTANDVILYYNIQHKYFVIEPLSVKYAYSSSGHAMVETSC